MNENQKPGMQHPGEGIFSLSFLEKIIFFVNSEGVDGVVQGGGAEVGFGTQKNLKISVEIQRKGLLYEKIRVNCSDPRTV